jgi:phosphoribosylanthranilate isomerase
VSLWIKICGVTSVEDALMVHEVGADAIGLNFVGSSPRCITPEVARAISDAVQDKLEVVGVFVDAPADELSRVYEQAGLDTVQLHGTESPEFVQALGEKMPCYKALRIGAADDVALAQGFPGDRILTDAKVPGAMGGTGQTFDWDLIEGLNEERKLILAGGLNAENVEECVRAVLPYGIDTASGVELAAGKKSEELTRAFVQAARRGYRG